MAEPIRPIHDESDYLTALAEIDELFDAPPGSANADRLEVLAVLVAEYERASTGRVAPHPVDVLNVRMKAQGRTQADLAKLLGSRSRASEVLANRRGLSAEMARKVANDWAIPTSLLSAPYVVRGRLKRALRRVAISAVAIVALCAATVMGVQARYGSDVPSAARLRAAVESQRNLPAYTPVKRVPPEVVKALLAAEDGNFYGHRGYSSVRSLVAAWHAMVHGKAQGGSTITQQLAKHVLGDERRSIGRKVKELIAVRRLETVLTKDEILEAYLNRVDFGAGQVGIGAASAHYFGKAPSDLSVAQAAYLAGVVRSPGRYDIGLVENQAPAKARRDWVLSRMAVDGMITQSAARLASAEPLVASRN